MSGKNRGRTGKVTRVDMRRCRVYIDALKRKNAKGKEFDVPTSSSNVYITDLNLADRYRAEKLRLKAVKEEPKPKAQKAAAVEKAIENK